MGCFWALENGNKKRRIRLDVANMVCYNYILRYISLPVLYSFLDL